MGGLSNSASSSPYCLTVPLAPGEIYQVYYPHREDKTKFTRRPAMFLSENDDGSYKMCQITGTNRVGEIKGEWIDKNSKEYSEMGLSKPSFINLEQILSVPRAMVIRGPIGKYHDIEKLIEIYTLK